MATKTIELPEIGTVKLYKRKGARSIRLSVDSSGGVRVSLPKWAPYDSGITFARSKFAWIQSQQLERQRSPLAHGQAIGKSHHLQFVPSASALRVSACVDGPVIRITHPLAAAATHESVQKAAEAACIRALRTQAERLLPQRLRTLAATHQFSYNSCSVKLLKSRWGSCDTDKNIVLNLFLMQLPWPLIDYVLLHELTHTRVLHHGPDFWAAFEQTLPDVKTYRKQIRAYRPAVESIPLPN